MDTSSLSMVIRRSSASSSFVLAAARLRALIALPSRMRVLPQGTLRALVL
jgi:hypothetical protein